MRNCLKLSLLIIYINLFSCQKRLLFPSFIHNKCQLSLGTTKIQTHEASSFIYSNNQLEPSYQAASPIHHQSPPSNDVDFIYSREQLSDPLTLPILNVNIHSHNTSITDPKVNINVLESENKNYRISEIEIIYNCNPKLSGFVLITMSIKAIFCKEISLTWEKHCNGNQLTHMPKINLGFSRGVHNIINHGILLSFHRNMIDKTYATKDSNHFLVTGNMLHLFISSGEVKKNLNVSTMTVSSPNSHINTNHNFNSSYISSTLVGDISKGGILEPNEDKEFYVFFECKDKEAKLDYGTDMQLDIPFDDNKIISLYFTKVCKVYKPLFIIRIIKFLYWCALMSVVGFILVIVYFLYNQGTINQYMIKEILNQTKGNINSILKGTINVLGNSADKNNPNLTSENENNVVMEDEDENEGLNIKISSGNITNNQTEDYGGI
jgi:hypothetical protein